METLQRSRYSWEDNDDDDDGNNNNNNTHFIEYRIGWRRLA
jgi:hypothetical protein